MTIIDTRPVSAPVAAERKRGRQVLLVIVRLIVAAILTVVVGELMSPVDAVPSKAPRSVAPWRS